jgi:ATP-dependent helicase STH1/SNF2
MSEGPIVTNGNVLHNGSGIGGDISVSRQAISVSFPETREQLNALLHKYQQLMKASNEAKEKHDNFVRYLENKENGVSDFKGTSSDVRPVFKDPTEEERLAIENVFYKISEQYQEFVKNEQTFYESIKAQKSEESLDLELLEKQIAGLQFLSKDLDLPESLQEDYESVINSESESVRNKDTDRFIEAFLRSKSNLNDFMKRAESLGIKVPQPLGSINPMHAPVGNYYTEQMISSKISNRIRELENLPANLGTFKTDSLKSQTNYDDLKIKALIELKSLQLLAKQKQLKKNLIISQATNSHYDNSDLNKVPLTLQARRSIYIRPKIIQPNPHLLASQLEEKRKLEANRIKHALHVEKVQQILINSEDFVNKKLNRLNKISTISRAINLFHSVTEKDESKKLEKTAKQRLQALKANDEEAYIKLLDQTKDHRITHLLKQTNTFLDSLAQAVKVQQVEQGADDISGEKHIENEVVPEKEDNVEELREKIDYYQVAHKVKEEIKEQPSILVGGTLKEYQVKGLEWMVSLYNNKLNGILADEMGLGKTIQSISLITYLIERKHEDKFLVVVPLSTITNWTMEFEKWAPAVDVIVYKGSQQQRKSMQAEVRSGAFQVILTTYEYIIRERPLLSKFYYSHMIIDEGHRMKNATSKLSITLKNYYKTKNRLILTGTPLQNNLPELWALLNFVLPKIFNSVKSFDEWFNTPFANTGSQEKIELTEEESLLVIRRLHKVLRPFLLRRLKKDVEKDLPDKVEKVLKCNLSGLQYVLYQQMLKHNALFVGVDVGGAKSGIKGLNNKIMQLRKICNHPFVFEEVETVLNSTRLTNDLIWRVSGKFELLDRVLPKFKASGHRVLIFFQMTQVMNIMEDFLRWRDMKYLRLDGATKAEDRQDMLKDFNAPNSDYFCFLLSTRAGGLGLNLQTADTVIIFDTDWNPHQDLQAQDRAHRIGQKNEVRILRLITNDSVEEVILERAHQKLDIDGKVIQAGKFDNKSTSEEQEAFLKRLLEAEASNDDNEENDSLDDEELNEVLARSEDEKVLFAQIDNERMINEKLASRQGGPKTRLLEKDELPTVFTEDVSHHFEKDTKELARMRDKKRVKYDDGLTEEQWLMAMDNDNDTVEDAIRRKEARVAKRRKNRGGSADLLSDDDEDIVDGDLDEENLRPRKRSRRSTTPQANGYTDNEDDISELEKVDDSNELVEKCTIVLDELCQLTAEADGHNISEIFMTLPSRKLYPDYYQVIKQPTSINQIKKNLKQENFESFESFMDSLQLMCTNAKTYNEEGSWVYEDATTVENFLSSKI